MASQADRAAPDGDELRRLVPVFSLGVTVLALAYHRPGADYLALAAIPVVALTLLTFVPRVPLIPVWVAVIVPVVLAQRSGVLEPLLFHGPVLGFVVARWYPTRLAVPLGLLTAVAPIVAGAIDPSPIGVPIWVVGVAFPWGIGWVLARQVRLGAQLDLARRQLADEMLLSERRRIARDVHDLVGHGLTAVMLQVTSARYVLRRDPAAAEEALRSAEDVGRRSMQELRRTVALLRSDHDMSTAPLPTATEIAALVDHARAGGLDVELRARGDLSRIPPGVGVTMYRIGQEAVANAARHAPHARTVLALELDDGRVQLSADTRGPVIVSATSERRRYGLIGMRERALALGGDFTAGPTPDGWRVSCSVPLELNGSGGASRRA